jgi:ATP-dependent DNA helicase RecG
VADRASGADAFVGTDLDGHVVRAGVYERTVPHLDVTIEEMTVNARRLVLVAVPEGLEVYGTSDGRYSWRRRDTCPPMSADDLARLREERAGEDWSSRSARRGRSDDAEPLSIARARALLSVVPEGGPAGLASSSVDDLLDGLGLLKRGYLTHAGWLMFGQRDRASAPSIIYQHRSTAGGEPDRVIRFAEPLVVAVDRLIEVVEARLTHTPVNLPGGQQVAVADFPPRAVREALLNAVVHGDHRTGRPIQIEHSPEELSITSPGPLVAGVTPDNILRHPHRARFPSLFHGFRFLGLVEQVGLGVDRMFREMLRFGRRPPEILEGDAEVTVRFVADQPNVRIARFVNDLPRGEQDDLDVLLVLSLLRDRRTVRAADVADVVQRTPDEAQRLLRRLAADDRALLEPTPGTSGRRHPSYRLRGSVLAALGPAVSYHRAPTTERDRKIVEHVQEYGSVNNRTVQNLFDIDVYKASAVLRELVGRGLLVRTSEQTRGNAVKYGRGPSFPGSKRRG